jgi:hypothetical protein
MRPELQTVGLSHRNGDRQTIVTRLLETAQYCGEPKHSVHRG